MERQPGPDDGLGDGDGLLGELRRGVSGGEQDLRVGGDHGEDVADGAADVADDVA